jgi:serine/threonine protein kinase
MGEVYAARQNALGRLVAVKFLALEGGGGSSESLDRFRREAELMARVTHPNILSVYDFGAIEGRPYLVMEYVEGGDLRRRMTPGEPAAVRQVRAIVGPVCEALACLHRQGILHRDLKPENILMHEETNPKVADFGIAVLRARVGSLTQTGIGLGTVGYVAPEQQYCLKVDERADQYSLAAIAYELLTGEKSLGIFKPPSDHNPRLDARVDAVVMRALQDDPEARYPSVREFGAALDEALEGLATRRRGHSARLLSGLAGVGALLAVAVLVATGYLPGPPSPRPPGGGVALGISAGSPPEATGPREPDDPAFAEAQRKLVELRAYLSWIEQGRPRGDPGKAVEEANWTAAERETRERVESIAYQLWLSSGRPGGEEGRIAARANRLAAQEILRMELERAISLAGEPTAQGSGPSPPPPAADPPPPSSSPPSQPGDAGDGRPSCE